MGRGFPINLSMLEFVKFQLRHIIPVTLSEGEITLAAYIHLHDLSFMDKYMSDGHSRSTKSVENYVSKLKKLGILTQDRRLNPEICLTKDPTRYIHFFNIVPTPDETA